MNIILADTHGPILGKSQATPNLGLLYLATYASKFRKDLRFHYLPQKRKRTDHFEMIKELNPEIYAMSFTSYGAPVAFSMVREIKARFPKVKVICGGPHVTPFPREVLEKTQCDVCVIGEGEVSFLELINNIDRVPQDIRHIKS